jgi:hypothetical protein
MSVIIFDKCTTTTTATAKTSAAVVTTSISISHGLIVPIAFEFEEECDSRR